MTQIGTTGLMASHSVLMHRMRRLPVEGEVLVHRGMRVSPETIVARAELPGPVRVVPIAQPLGVPADRTLSFMTVPINSSVRQGDLLAKRSTLWGRLTSEVRAPVAGTVESVSSVTGQLVLRAPPKCVEVAAYLDGVVTRVLTGEGVVVSSRAALIQGIFGVGGETWGRLCVLDDDAPVIGPEHRGSIVVVPGRIAAATIQAALTAGAGALLGASVHDVDLCGWLGYELCGGVTGSEKAGLTLIVTEGFGDLRMSRRTCDLLRQLNGRTASVNGATQIRAGVQRPEVLVSHVSDVPCDGVDDSLLAELAAAPSDESPSASVANGDPIERLCVGLRVRLIRAPRFGAEGVVEELPPRPEKLATEAVVRVAVVRLTDGTLVRTPRANIEWLGEG